MLTFSQFIEEEKINNTQKTGMAKSAVHVHIIKKGAI